MVQPGSATVISARACARADGCPGRAGPASAITVTWRARPGWRGAATPTPTSRVCPAPGARMIDARRCHALGCTIDCTILPGSRVLPEVIGLSRKQMTHGPVGTPWFLRRLDRHRQDGGAAGRAPGPGGAERDGVEPHPG